MSASSRPRRILPVIIFAVFSGTSLWFSGNAILPDIQQQLSLEVDAIANVTSSVQSGFILGTLVFALLTIADRFPPGRVFFLSSVLGAVSNALIVWVDLTEPVLLVSRFLTGFFLAGVYPVGMKIASLWFKQDLGRAIGHLVGALVLGTAFPHLVRAVGLSFDWQWVILVSTALAIAGGMGIVWLIPDLAVSKRIPHFEGRALLAIFRVPDFRSAASGYFGHMWELYTLWAFIPLIIESYNQAHPGLSLNVSLWSFLIIAAGLLGCSVGGELSLKRGNAPVAFVQLAGSMLCCLFFPLLFDAHWSVFLAYMLFWGVVVVGDSPQFSTLNARTAPAEVVGSALTLVVCIGFGLSIASIYMMHLLIEWWGLKPAIFLMGFGPMAGLVAMRKLMRRSAASGN